MIPLGVRIGNIIRVGTLLGEGNVKFAKMVGKMAMITGIIFNLINGLITILFKEQIINLFHPDGEVYE